MHISVSIYLYLLLQDLENAFIGQERGKGRGHADGGAGPGCRVRPECRCGEARRTDASAPGMPPSPSGSIYPKKSPRRSGGFSEIPTFPHGLEVGRKPASHFSPTLREEHHDFVDCFEKIGNLLIACPCREEITGLIHLLVEGCKRCGIVFVDPFSPVTRAAGP